MAHGALKVLVAEDDGFTRALVSDSLRSNSYEVTAVETVAGAMRELGENDYHVVVTDLNFGPGPSGADLLNRVHEDQPWVGMVALTSHASPALAVGPSATLPASTVYRVTYGSPDVPSWTSPVGSATRS